MAEIYVPWQQTAPATPVSVSDELATIETDTQPQPQPEQTTQGEIYIPWSQRQTQTAQTEADQYGPVEKFSARFLGDPGEVASLGQRIVAETAPAVIGGIAGGRYGASTGVPGGAAIGTVLGGAFGALTGKRLDELVGNVRPDEQTLISDFITAAGGSLAAPGVITKNSANEVMKYLAKQGIRKPTPGTVSDSKVIQALEQKLKEIPFSGGNIDAAVLQMYDDFGRAVDHLADESTLVFRGPSQAGEVIKKGAQSRLDAFHWRGDALYGVVKKLVGDQNPSVDPGRLMNVIDELGASGYDNAKLGELFGDDLLKSLTEAMEGGAKQSWHDMDKVRRRIGDKMRYNSGEDLGLMKQLYGAIADDMEVTVRGMGKHEQKAWRSARDFWKKWVIGKEEQLSKVADHGKPEQLFNSLITGNMTDVAKARAAVGGDNWSAVQDLVINRMGQVADEPGAFNARQFISQWKRINKDSDAAKNLFGDRYKELEQLVGIAKRLENPKLQANYSGTAVGNFMMPLLTGTAGVAGYAAGDLSGAAIGIAMPAVTPYVMSRIWTSPTLLKWLTKGKDVPTNSFKKTSAWGKAFLSMAGAEGINEYEALQVYDMIMAPFESDLPSVPGQ